MQKLEIRVSEPLNRAEDVRSDNEHQLRALVIDGVNGGIVNALQQEGVVVDSKPGLSKDEVCKALCDYDILVGRTRIGVDRWMMENSPRLKMICRAAVGIENIDVEEASKRGIKVINAPGAATESVAELALSLTLDALRNVHDLASKLRGGAFEKRMGNELCGKTVGIVGFGRIGSRFAELISPFKVNVLANDLPVMRERIEKSGFTFAEKDQLLSNSDIISIHVNMDANKKPVVGDAELAKMKKGVIIINTGRAAAVDLPALHASMADGKVGFYAADVFWHEPPKDRLELEMIAMENALFTPHIGAQTNDAQARVADTIVPGMMEAIRECKKRLE
jgi:D-3-phosphoglycerate dehydrogenase / 2-oxoglutarate reductase